MPPDYNQLPIPKKNKLEDNTEKNLIKKLITNVESEESISNVGNNANNNLEKFLLEKIKTN